MSRKIVSLQIGQCGNAVGKEFWSTISNEHGIGPDGILKNQDYSLEDRKDVFFYQSDSGRYIPRAILIDLEDRVIVHSILNSEFSNFYNPENIFIGKEGGGAGNNWGRGFELGEKFYGTIQDMVRREVEVADSLEGFIFTHSIAGGTGSGMGSFLLERLSDEYKKSTILTYSVFPGEESQDVTVLPYNEVLTLKRLINNADAVVVVDNTALASITNPRILGLPTKTETDAEISLTQKRDIYSFAEMNRLVSTVMAATTATLRFPSYSNNDLVSLLSPLIPTPMCHFLMTGYTPITLSSQRQYIQKTSVIDVMNRLLDSKNIMVSADMSQGVYMSILNILQGDIDPSEIHSALRQIHENQRLRFIPWGPASIQLALSRKSPYVPMSNRVSGLMLANHTNIKQLFAGVLNQYNKMWQSNAYLNGFQQCGASCLGDNLIAEFNDSSQTVKNVLDAYKQAESDDFLTR